MSFSANTDADSESRESADEGHIQQSSAGISSSSDHIPPNRVLSSLEVRERRVRGNDDTIDIVFSYR